jgi:hypothetical protein
MYLILGLAKRLGAVKNLATEIGLLVGIKLALKKKWLKQNASTTLYLM